MVSAHLDTVFPEGTDVTVREKDGGSMRPASATTRAGWPPCSRVIRAFNATGVKTVGDIIFVGTVGEEGPRRPARREGAVPRQQGHRRLHLDRRADIDRIVYHATGSHRYRIIFKGPGGHSFQEFGLPSAIHAMGRAIAKIAELQTPEEPKTTFTVGTVSGGTSVNAIAADARHGSRHALERADELLKLEAQVLDARQGGGRGRKHALEHRTRSPSRSNWSATGPPASSPIDSPIVQAAQRAVTAVTRAPASSFAGSSTDSNIAMSLGIPAVTIGGGGEGGNWHSRNEWYKPVNAWHGPQNALLTVLMLTGLDGVTKPALAVRKAAK